MDNIFVPVMGLHCSGSSCTAGVLAHMGIHMGNHSAKWDVGAGFEAAGLIAVCEGTFPFPSTERQLPFDESSLRIKKFIDNTIAYARKIGTLAGGKYPHLCAMGQELEQSGAELKPIHITRPLDVSIRSLAARSQSRDDWTATTSDKAEAVQRWLWEQKMNFLEAHEHLNVEYYDLLENPGREIERIAEYLSYVPTEKQIQSAIGHVDPTQRKFV